MNAVEYSVSSTPAYAPGFEQSEEWDIKEFKAGLEMVRYTSENLDPDPDSL